MKLGFQYDIEHHKQKLIEKFDYRIIFIVSTLIKIRVRNEILAKTKIRKETINIKFSRNLAFLKVCGTYKI